MSTLLKLVPTILLGLFIVYAAIQFQHDVIEPLAKVLGHTIQ